MSKPEYIYIDADKMAVHKDDEKQVKVIAGKDKGKTGEVFIIDRKNLKAKVRGINIVKKHRKPSQDQPGGIEQIETFINISNISLIDPNDNKASRV